MIASLSLDLDNKWSYLKTHGDAGWEAYPTYLPHLVPHVIDLLERVGLTITFFVVGRDADDGRNHDALRQIIARGHEIGNHSYNHEPWLHEYSPAQLESELAKTEDALVSLGASRPVGFRGPGFSHCPLLFETLARRGYRYDASTFPTFLGPIARAYYFFSSRLDRQQRQQRKALFGRVGDGFGPLRPHRLQQSQLLEIPVTTMPWAKVPIHLSYVMYLADKSKWLARRYFYHSLKWCRLNRIAPSLLLHPLDFWGCDNEPDLGFFPAMKTPTAAKTELAAELLGWMAREFECLTMAQHADQILSGVDSGLRSAARQSDGPRAS